MYLIILPIVDIQTLFVICMLCKGVTLFIVFQEYFKLRMEQVNSLKAKGESPYPHKFHVEMSLSEYIEKYNDTTSPGEVNLNEQVSVAGV